MPSPAPLKVLSRIPPMQRTEPVSLVLDGVAMDSFINIVYGMELGLPVQIDQSLRRRPDLPRFMAGGPANPLGARALYLGSSLYRIHGSNEPETIGQAVSSGCIRMVNDDVIDLYGRVKIGAKVIVL